MGKLVAGLSISLDGYIAGPGDGPGNPLGDGGERLHEWVTRLRSWRHAHGMEGGETGRDDELFAASFGAIGAFLMGRRMFDHGEGPWGDDPPFRRPVFVVTHRPRDPLVKGETRFEFLGDLDEAVDRAREAAGEGDVGVGGGQLTRQLIAAGRLEELQLQVVPVFLGGGVTLLDGLPAEAPELRCVEAIDANGIAHLRFRPAR